MSRKITKALAAVTVMALPLLSACGESTAPAAGSASTASALSTSTAVASPTPSATPVDETKNVQAASSNFMKVAFVLGGAVQTSNDWSDRVKPLMSTQGYDKLRGEATVDKTLKALKTQFGGNTRTLSGLVGKAKVTKLDTDRATVDIKFQSRLEQQSGDTWKTLKKSPEETGTLELVKQGEKWLVDDAG